MSFTTAPRVTENLFLNTLKFKFPTEPVTFYFMLASDKMNYTTLTRLNCPIEFKKAGFKSLGNTDKVYSTFKYPQEGFTPVKVNLSLSDNYYFAKKYYNRLINKYFKHKGIIVDQNSITNDNQIWILNNQDNDIPDSNKYDRYSLKVDFDHFNNTPQLVLSFDRPTWVLHKSVEQILSAVDDPFSPIQPSANLFGRVLYRIEQEGITKHIVDKYKYLASKDYFDSANAFPVINREIKSFLKISDGTLDVYEESQVVIREKPKNRYTKYYNKIHLFYQNYLDNEEFRAIVNIHKNGFSRANPLQIGHTNSSSKQLIFGNNITQYNPQMGINNGPYQATPYSNIKLLSIFQKKDKDIARNLLIFFKNNYKNFFDGLKKYIGKDFSFSKDYLEIQDVHNIIGELDNFLFNTKLDSNSQYVAIYLTPIGKHSADHQARKIYYQVKERLLKYRIVSQCIETEKMLAILKDDDGKDKYGNPRKNFAYTLQNMSIAINAKIAGTPWRLSSPKQNELVVGVGAFRNVETDTQYIGSAFSFDNTGSFNSFEYFQKDELRELAGSIQNAIINFTKINNKPERLIIHYYKRMNSKEFSVIENALHKLDVDIPIYVVSICKTESEDFVLFDGGDNSYSDLMPYSGRYVNLGNNSYLLCNNTRYENCKLNPYDGFPFPIKIKIECPNDSANQIDTNIISQLIDQVYQFSRIYWKSVKQQNLPVTIKYPEMIAQMLPYFQNATTSIDTKHLWFL